MSQLMASLKSLGTRPFRLFDIPGKGRGLIATRAITRGERVLTEKPFLSAPFKGRPRKFIRNCVSINIEPHEATLAALHNSLPDLPFPFGTILTNGIDFRANTRRPTEIHVYELASRFNHDCTPSIAHHWDTRLEHATFHATRPIDEGEELTVTYLNPFLARRARKTELKRRFNFECACEACSSTHRASDRRRRYLNSILHLSSSASPLKYLLDSMFETPEEIIRDTRKALEYLAHERLILRRGELITRAWQLARNYGDEDSEKEWAKLLMESKEMSEGTDSAAYAEAKALVNSPVRRNRNFLTTQENMKVGGPR